MLAVGASLVVLSTGIIRVQALEVIFRRVGSRALRRLGRRRARLGRRAFKGTAGSQAWIIRQPQFFGAPPSP